jgi:hypothetical protein
LHETETGGNKEQGLPATHYQVAHVSFATFSQFGDWSRVKAFTENPALGGIFYESRFCLHLLCPALSSREFRLIGSSSPLHWLFPSYRQVESERMLNNHRAQTAFK